MIGAVLCGAGVDSLTRQRNGLHDRNIRRTRSGDTVGYWARHAGPSTRARALTDGAGSTSSSLRICVIRCFGKEFGLFDHWLRPLRP
jgi:hypothetical protein